MLDTKKMLYGLDDVCIIPAMQSWIDSRSQCAVTIENSDELPIFVAPMSCLVNYQNHPAITRLRMLDIQEGKGYPVCARINAILPRSEKLEVRLSVMTSGEWVAFSLLEAKQLAEKKLNFEQKDCSQYNICIDMANGHLHSIPETCKKLKKTFAERGLSVNIMVGNIARPDTYRYLCGASVDFVRLGIGSGNVCTTSVQTGVHYPMASLIAECHEIRCTVGERACPKIVADGGFQRIDQCIKALALGADFVMLGQIIAKSNEACGKEYRKAHYKLGKGTRFIPKEEADAIERNENQGNANNCICSYSYISDHSLQEEQPIFIEPGTYREYYGMSTYRAQREFSSGTAELKHSEGLETYVTVDYHLTEWLSDFAHALRSAMSYTGCSKLEDFIQNTECGLMSRADFNSYMYKKV